MNIKSVWMSLVTRFGYKKINKSKKVIKIYVPMFMKETNKLLEGNL